MKPETKSPRSIVLARRQLLRTGAAWSMLGTLAPLAEANTSFPSQPVRIILPLPPGGAADKVARAIADRLSDMWKQPVLVESRPGGGMVVGTLATARSKPDGHTIGVVGGSMSINHVQRSDLPYDALKELQPVARLGYYTIAVLASHKVPANDMPGLIQWVKAQSAPISCGSNGIGTSTELGIELLNQMAGINLRHVPYPGGPKLYTDMLGGHIDLAISIMGAADGFLQTGQLKVLGVTGPTRVPYLPQAAPIAETLPGYEVLNWTGFAVPAGVPQDVVTKISRDILSVAERPEVRKIFLEMGIVPAPLGVTAMSDFVQADIRKVAAVTSRKASLLK
ncbi:Bug family tripartite tricarboxylate transporter substrate binding protein [Ottowia thiooxydans]|uniref:Tripartite-type tricarboxylate transporter receptor subunit TctC n=1 Tax=Ottowia thiooxydans TaxID=219182 RepID=A0ABV2Q2X1_9BURK